MNTDISSTLIDILREVLSIPNNNKGVINYSKDNNSVNVTVRRD